MRIRDFSHLSVSAFLAYRLRSFLTALGIAVGITAVVLLTSIGEGIHQFVLSEFSQFGTNIIGINPGVATTHGVSIGIFGSEQPLTIGDSEALRRIPYVDVVSFHHWSGVPQVASRIAALQKATDKPVLLQEFGYSTLTMDPVAQATLITDVIHGVEQAHAAGWLIWTAFDFPTDATCMPPNCPSVDNAEHHFGLWSAGYTPKLVVNLLLP